MNPAPAKKSNLSQLERVREIHRLTQRFTENPQNESLRVTCEILAGKLEVTDRQIRRDIQVLMQRIEEKDVEGGHGAKACALNYDAKRRSYLYTREVDLSVWVGRLDDEHLGALLVAQQALAVFTDMPLAKHINHIFEEDAGGLVGNSRSSLQEEITNLISFHPEGMGEINEEHFALIYRGLLLQQQLEVTYQSKTSSKPIKRILHPYHLCCFKNQWRLIAHDSHRDEVRDFVVTKRRLGSVKLIDGSFTRPKHFDRQKAHHHISGRHSEPTRTVKLRIARDGVHHVLDRKWVDLVSKVERPDGSVEATFKIGDSGEFLRFVLGFGRDCEVLEPANFREEVRAQARGILEGSEVN